MPDKLSMHQKFIQKLNAILDLKLENEKFGVSELAAELGLSRSQLHRRLQDINGKSSSQYIREYRLEKAMEMLKSNEATASEIAYRVGFSSPTYFNTCFHNFYGYPPGEVKYQRAIALPKKTYSKKLLGFIPVIILVGFIVFNKMFNKSVVAEGSVEKTIAVLPFVNESNNKENMYFCNGIMAGIRDHLAKIPEFYVVSRISVEQYRGTSMPLKVIARELDVNYVLEGHVQRIGDRAIISAELINVNNNKVLWSERYEEDVSEIFAVQANVIQSITNNLETIISPTLAIELNAKPTLDTLAYNHYLKGEEYRFRANRIVQKTEDWLDLLSKANSYYELAIERDSLFANAYLGLAFSTYEKNAPYVIEGNNLENVLSLINKALELNPNLELAYLLRGNYYSLFKENDKAKEDYYKVVELNPNRVSEINRLISIYVFDNKFKEVAIILKNFEKTAKSNKDLSNLYYSYVMLYELIGQYNMVDYYYRKRSDVVSDSYFNRGKVWSYLSSNRIDEAIDYMELKTSVDNQDRNGYLGLLYLVKGDYNQALFYLEKCYAQITAEGINSRASMYIYSMYGRTLVHLGQIEKGEEMMRRQIPVFNKILNDLQIHDTPIILISFISLYGGLGEYEKAYEYMTKFEDANGWAYGGLLSFAKFIPLFDPLRDDERFQKFIAGGEKQIDNIRQELKPYLPFSPPSKTD